MSKRVPSAAVSCPACGHDLSMFDEVDETRAERMASRIADVVATWMFACAVIVVIALWVLVNMVWQPFQPYPVIIFAVVSAVLATLAALQGPLILLSARHAAERDRERDREVLMVVANSEADLHRVEAKLDRVLAALPQSDAG